MNSAPAARGSSFTSAKDRRAAMRRDAPKHQRRHTPVYWSTRSGIRQVARMDNRNEFHRAVAPRPALAKTAGCGCNAASIGERLRATGIGRRARLHGPSRRPLDAIPLCAHGGSERIALGRAGTPRRSVYEEFVPSCGDGRKPPVASPAATHAAVATAGLEPAAEGSRGTNREQVP
jgi:hypothetical protein